MNRFYTEKNTNQIWHDRIRVLIMTSFMLFCFIGQLQAQCYEKSRSNGIAEMKSKHYDKAIQWFQQAKDCDDKPANNDLDSKIKECQNLKAKAAKDKKDAEDKRRQQEEEARLREEQERIQREFEEEQERQMAQRAYMHITGVRFINVDEKGTPLTNSGILYWQDIKYILPVLEYDGLADDDRYTTLYCKIYKPNGVLTTFADSPYNYSYSYSMIVEPGYNNEQQLTSWGNKDGGTFTQGTYTFEIYNNMGEKLDSRTFPVFDKPPTTISVTFRVADKDAYIYVNNSYAGKGSSIMELELGKTYNVETRKTSHTSPYMTVTASKTMNTTIDLPSPEPIYGSLSITASKNDVDVYVNDKFRGKAPIQLDQVLIGDYSVKMTKEKFYDFRQTVTVKASQRSTVHAEMERIKNTPWLFRKPDSFASVFLEPVYAFDYGLNFDELGSVGGHFTYCGSHLGFFAQYLHGIENKNQSYSGGLVLRLTNRSVDLQLLGGVAYNRMIETNSYYNGSYYDNYTYTNNAWMGNAGIRIGWTSGSFSWWDLMGGVMFDGDHTIPYVGLGLGITFSAGLVGAGVYGLSLLKQ